LCSISYKPYPFDQIIVLFLMIHSEIDGTLLRRIRNGIIKNEISKETFKHGDVFFILHLEWHQFVNTGKDTLKFLCIIPYKE